MAIGMEKKYYIILSERLTYRYVQYKEGLNVYKYLLSRIDNGLGLHFLDAHSVLGFTSYGTRIADVEIPEDATVYELSGGRLKANKIIIKNIRELWNIDVLKELESQGADFQNRKENLLHNAAKAGSLDMVKYFIEEEGLDVKGVFHGYNLAERAAEAGHLNVLRYLAEKGADIHTYNDWPLHLAAENGHLDVVKYLLEQGVDIHKHKEGLLHGAAENGHLDVVKYVMGFGCRYVYSDLLLAAENGHLEVVKYLAEQGVDIHAKNEFVLRVAVEHDYNLEVVKYLVEQGADIHADNDGPICDAAREGALNVVKYLVEQGADIHACDDYPLRAAKANGYVSVVEYLTEIADKAEGQK